MAYIPVRKCRDRFIYFLMEGEHRGDLASGFALQLWSRHCWDKRLLQRLILCTCLFTHIPGAVEVIALDRSKILNRNSPFTPLINTPYRVDWVLCFSTHKRFSKGRRAHYPTWVDTMLGSHRDHLHGTKREHTDSHAVSCRVPIFWQYVLTLHIQA